MPTGAGLALSLIAVAVLGAVLFRTVLRARGVVSAAVVPLMAERCVGALAVVTRTRRIFGDEDVSLLRAFGEHAAVALEKARVGT